MKNRLDIGAVAPEIYTAIGKLDAYFKNSDLSHAEIALMKTLASQINGCGYCVHSHSNEALEAGETVDKLILLGNWRETNDYTERECILLELVELVTNIQIRMPEEFYERALTFLGQKAFLEAFMVAVSINAWNRVGIAFEMRTLSREASS